jgi:cold shock CspA family protein
MHQEIDNRIRKNDPIIQSLFVKQQARVSFTPGSSPVNGVSSSPGNDISNGLNGNSNDDDFPLGEPNYNIIDSEGGEERKVSTIRSLKTGYGFINYPPNNLFFHYTSLLDSDFNELQVEDEVAFKVGKNAEGKDIDIDVQLLAV